MIRNSKLLIVLLATVLVLGGCFGKKTKNQPQAGSSAEPDKLLYERALDDIKHGRHTVGRLTLQTLINTYPDSEYLAKAKLAIADSYYKEGGVAGLTQAVAEYKDFITFFPFLDEAAYAQLQIGMAHYRRMEKPDRDRTEGRLAEEEFQTFLQKYPNDKRAAEAEQRLREVQEVLAEGDYRIAHFYYVKSSNRAAAARLLELTSRYPLYSQADRALWMLGTVYERSEKNEFASQYYARIVKDYPLSDLVNDAKEKLTKLGVPIPQPDPQALARMQREREFDRQRSGFLKRSAGGLLSTRPNVSMAARTGPPNLTPASEAASGTESLKPGGQQSVGSAGGTNNAVVETVAPGSATSNPPNASTSKSAASPGSPAGTSPSGAGSENTPNAKPSSTEAKSGEAKSATDDSKPTDQAKKDEKKKESSSKKKKGLRKIVPW